MSLKPRPVPDVPELTARVAFSKGNPYLRLRDELGALFRDDDFAHLYPGRGQPALPPWRLALVTVMQFAEDLSDRQAADVGQTAPIHAALAAQGLLPGDHLLDAGFMDVELLVGSQFEHGVRLVGPMRPDVSWQAQANTGFDVAHFTIDWEAWRVTCPEGRTSVLWKPGQDRWGNEVLHTEFARRECLACRSRPLCTRATTEGREMTLRPRELHEALPAARRQQGTTEWKTAYAVRAGVEGTLSQGVRGFGLRRCRYIGLAKARLQHVATAAAINVYRLSDWFGGVPRAATRTSPFARLVA